MAGGQQLPEQYTVPQYARIFHSLPHLNVSLHSVNNTFNPHSEIYLEVGIPRTQMYEDCRLDFFLGHDFTIRSPQHPAGERTDLRWLETKCVPD